MRGILVIGSLVIANLASQACLPTRKNNSSSTKGVEEVSNGDELPPKNDPRNAQQCKKLMVKETATGAASVYPVIDGSCEKVSTDKADFTAKKTEIFENLGGADASEYVKIAKLNLPADQQMQGCISVSDVMCEGEIKPGTEGNKTGKEEPQEKNDPEKEPPKVAKSKEVGPEGLILPCKAEYDNVRVRKVWGGVPDYFKEAKAGQTKTGSLKEGDLVCVSATERSQIKAGIMNLSSYWVTKIHLRQTASNPSASEFFWMECKYLNPTDAKNLKCPQ